MSTVLVNGSTTMFDRIYDTNGSIRRELQRLIGGYKVADYSEIRRHLNEQTSRIIWQKNENCHLRKYLNELKYAPLKEVTKAQLLQSFHQRLLNLNTYTDETESRIESTCVAVKRDDSSNPLFLGDYALSCENGEVNEVNVLSSELRQMRSLAESGDADDDEARIHFLSDKIVRNIELNSSLKSQLKAIEDMTKEYEVGTALLSECSEAATDSDENSNQFESNGDLMASKWELIPYDVSNLLHKSIEMSVEEIQQKYAKVVQTYRISEKLFCKAVLNTTSKVIKRLFAQNTSWSTMKAKDKIIVLRIYMWINDPDGVKKLREWTNQIKTIEFDQNEHPTGATTSKDCIEGSTDDMGIISYDVENMTLPYGVNALDICSSFKRAIEKHGISQKLFAKAVLNVAQSTISKFLSKPKQYFETNSLAKTTYLKMYAWLSDSKGLEKLQKWTEKWKWNEHTQNEIDILEEITRNKHENNIEYDTFDLSITKQITTREIRDRLKSDLDTNKISQKLFAKAVLNKAESTLSLLLSNPKTWETLNLKSKEKYLQIYKWLIDPERLVKLDVWEKKEHEKRTRVANKVLLKSSKAALTRQQEIYLTKSFQINMYPTKEQMKSIAVKLSLNLIKVVNWYNHKRRKHNMQKRISKSVNLMYKMQRQQQLQKI